MGLWNWITGYDEENAERAAAADAELRRLNAERATIYGPEWQAQVDRNYATQEVFGREAQEAEIGKAFDEGWREGRDNVSGFVGGIFKVVADVLKAVLFGIPLWMWALALLFVAWRFGFLAKLLRKVKA